MVLFWQKQDSYFFFLTLRQRHINLINSINSQNNSQKNKKLEKIRTKEIIEYNFFDWTSSRLRRFNGRALHKININGYHPRHIFVKSLSFKENIGKSAHKHVGKSQFTHNGIKIRLVSHFFVILNARKQWSNVYTILRG